MFGAAKDAKLTSTIPIFTSGLVWPAFGYLVSLSEPPSDRSVTLGLCDCEAAPDGLANAE